MHLIIIIHVHACASYVQNFNIKVYHLKLHACIYSIVGRGIICISRANCLPSTLELCPLLNSDRIRKL